MTIAISAANLTADHDTANRTATAYTTASVAFVRGRVYMLAIRGRSAAGSPSIGSVAGGGNTWALLQTVTVSNIKLWLYYCIAASTTAGTITVTPDGVTTWTQAGWVVDEFSDASGVAQSAQNSETASHSSLTVTLSAFTSYARNATYGVFAQNEDSELTPGSGFVVLGASTEASENANRIRSIWKAGGDTSVDIATSTTASDVLGIAAEISVAVTPSFTPININDGRKLQRAVAMDAITGAYGAVTDRFRVYIADTNTPSSSNARIADISEWVKSFSVAWDADACKRSGRLDIDPTILGNTLRLENASQTLLWLEMDQRSFFICHEIMIWGRWFRWPVGWFRGIGMQLDHKGQRPVGNTSGLEFSSEQKIISYQLADIVSYFDYNVTATTYNVAAGTEYTKAVYDAIVASNFWLNDADPTDQYKLGPSFKVKKFDIGASGKVTPSALSWQAGTTWATIINALFDGANFFPIWSTNDGALMSGARLRPHLLPITDWFGPAASDVDTPVSAAEVGASALLSLKFPNVFDSMPYELRQDGLWNQVVVTGNNVTSGQSLKVAQLPTSSNNSYLSQGATGRWVTKKVSVDAAADATTLQEIADWYAYYADFHSLIVDTTQVAHFFDDYVLHPNTNCIGFPSRNPFALQPEIWTGLGYSYSYPSKTMRKTYGTGANPYYLTLLNPSTPS